MPYKSDAQRRYFNANRDELESQGVDVDEWNESSKGKDLPEKVSKKEKEAAIGPAISAAAKFAPRLGNFAKGIAGKVAPRLGNFAKGPARKAIRGVAGVKPGQTFAAKPVINSMNAASFSGVPGLRVLNAGAVGMGGASAARVGVDTYQNLSKNIDQQLNKVPFVGQQAKTDLKKTVSQNAPALTGSAAWHAYKPGLFRSGETAADDYQRKMVRTYASNSLAEALDTKNRSPLMAMFMNRNPLAAGMDYARRRTAPLLRKDRQALGAAALPAAGTNMMQMPLVKDVLQRYQQNREKGGSVTSIASQLGSLAACVKAADQNWDPAADPNYGELTLGFPLDSQENLQEYLGPQVSEQVQPFLDKYLQKNPNATNFDDFVELPEVRHRVFAEEYHPDDRAAYLAEHLGQKTSNVEKKANDMLSELSRRGSLPFLQDISKSGSAQLARFASKVPEPAATPKPPATASPARPGMNVTSRGGIMKVDKTSIAADLGAQAARVKAAVDIDVAPRKSAPVHGFIPRVVYGKEELDPPSDDDVTNWQGIGDYMTAAYPTQLSTAKVLSGRQDPAAIINQIKRHQKHDAWPENVFSTRDQLAAAYAQMPPTMMEQFPASYHPHANSVVLNERSPGVLIHELGHGADMAPREGENKFKRMLRWNLKPALWKELSAWRKGRQAYQRGFGASEEVDDADAMKRYGENMKSLSARKYPALGTYFGGATGGLGGAIAGGIAAHKMRMDPDVAQLAIILSSALGGTAGIMGGALGGKLWSKLRAKAHARKAIEQLQKARNRPDVADVRSRLLALRAARTEQEDEKKAPLGKAAESTTSTFQEETVTINKISLAADLGAQAARIKEANTELLDRLQGTGDAFGGFTKAVGKGALTAGAIGGIGVPAGLGALAGGLYGAVAPGHNREGEQRSRLMEALKRGLIGGVGGAALGGVGAVGAAAGGLAGAHRSGTKYLDDNPAVKGQLGEAFHGESTTPWLRSNVPGYSGIK